MILIIFGNGVDCQTVLGSNPSVAATPKGVRVFRFGGTSASLIILTNRITSR